MNKGKYLEDDLIDARSTDFCIGVAGYPEKHFEAPNLDTDIQHLKQKVDAGASYIVTQMFYKNAAFFEFERKCRDTGIKVPIIPGLKIITSKNNLSTLPRNFHIDLPTDLTRAIMNHKSNDIHEIGVEWAYNQVQELLAKGVPAIHFYVMQNSRVINILLDKIGL